MRVLRPVPLSREAFRPYGSVVAAGLVPGKPANRGTARRFNHLARLVSTREGATANVCVFRCEPLATPTFELTLLEKHPASTQLFVPMNAERYLVVVALGAHAPDLSTLAVFEAEGTQGVAYDPGVWHHPLLALDRETDFGCVVWEDEGPDDCAEWHGAGVFVSLEPDEGATPPSVDDEA